MQPRRTPRPLTDPAYLLSEIVAADRDAFVEHLAAREIHEQTLLIPYPYTGADADWWINHVAELTRRVGLCLNWAIREAATGRLIGSVGFKEFAPGADHKAEIGYWLAKPWWGRGIMTDAVRAASRIGLEEYGLSKITAHVFAENPGSQRVLEKAGYAREGLLRAHHRKDGRLRDSVAFGLLREG